MNRDTFFDKTSDEVKSSAVGSEILFCLNSELTLTVDQEMQAIKMCREAVKPTYKDWHTRYQAVAIVATFINSCRG